jgi:hypothetical protein
MAGPFLNQGAWRTSITAMDSTQQEELGALRFENGKAYKYVKATAASIAANSAASHSDTTGTLVVLTPAASTATARSVAGIAETAFTTSGFGWLTVYGTATALVDTNAVQHVVLQAATTAGALAGAFTISAAIVTTGGYNSNKICEALTTGVITGSMIFIRGL